MISLYFSQLWPRRSGICLGSLWLRIFVCIIGVGAPPGVFRACIMVFLVWLLPLGGLTHDVALEDYHRLGLHIGAVDKTAAGQNNTNSMVQSCLCVTH